MRLVVAGRPLLRSCGGALTLGEPVRVCTEAGRIASVADWARDGHEDLGHPDAVLAPALSDSHAHLVAAASARTALDLAQDAPRDVATLLSRLREYTVTRPPGEWVRVRGYDEHALREHRHPTAGELDEAVPQNPVRLRHATLHGSLLNGLGRRRAGLPAAAGSDAPALVVGHEEALGLLRGDRDAASLRLPLAELGAELAAAGIASIDDITASNDADRVRLLADAVEQRWLPQRVRVWLRDAGEEIAARDVAAGRVEIAGVKLLPTTEDATRTGAFHAAICRARAAGLAIAIHAVEPDVIGGALDALAAAPPRRLGGSRAPDRLEHCSLCPPHLVERLATAGVAVVTQPGFLVARGRKYEREVEEPLWPWLYPLRSLRDAGVLVAGSSDAPVISPDPRLGFVGATTRRSAEGVSFGEDEVVSEAVALEMCTSAAARVRGDADADLPWLRAGSAADLVVLETDPVKDGLASWRAAETVIGGRRAGLAS